MTVEEYNKSVDLYSDNVYRFILKNIKDKDEAKDIVQESFEKLWVRSSEVSFEKVKSYLFTVAYHNMIDNIRKSKRISSVDNIESISSTYLDDYNNIGEVLNELIKKLPDIQRSVILLRDYEGYSYEEIAEITSLSESQVKVYIYRGRLALKKSIGSIEALI
ncbi:MAG: RNA polymerase subunit sigma-24 [Bacteroidetes bacterium GWA2_31_9b]|nr:MAG: RNA polymerase subunit sigma-24 [Bacteroidetes bacterium GWA2_31_9b]